MIDLVNCIPLVAHIITLYKFCKEFIGGIVVDCQTFDFSCHLAYLLRLTNLKVRVKSVWSKIGFNRSLYDFDGDFIAFSL